MRQGAIATKFREAEGELTDSLGEEFETENWLDYSKDCKYIQEETHERILSEYDEVRKMLISMINNPDKWCL
jgi:four helix bundle protein